MNLRNKNIACLGAFLLAALLIQACGDNPDTSVPTAPSGSYTFSASIGSSGDIVTKGASSGASVEVIGDAITGGEVTVTLGKSASTPVTTTPASTPSGTGTTAATTTQGTTTSSTTSSGGSTGSALSGATTADAYRYGVPSSTQSGTSSSSSSSTSSSSGTTTASNNTGSSSTSTSTSTSTPTTKPLSSIYSRPPIETTSEPLTVASALDVATTQASDEGSNPLLAPMVNGTTPTADTTPIWSWTAATGGNGNFRYKLDNADLNSGATETKATSYTSGNVLSEGTHTLYVQESDDSGNWSDAGSMAIVIDSTGPKAPVANPAAGKYDKSLTITLKPEGDAKATYYTTTGKDPSKADTEYKAPITIDGDNGVTVTVKSISYDALGNKGPVLTAAYVFNKGTLPVPTEPVVVTKAETSKKEVKAVEEQPAAKEEAVAESSGWFGCSLVK